MDSWMIERTWFLRKDKEGDIFSSESVPREKRYEAIQNNLKQDTNYASKLSYIFLVREPLTFGHSQLVIKLLSFPEEPKESVLFGMAAPIIQSAISVFENVFAYECVHLRPEFARLAQVTWTDEAYVKTLILRSSAKESDGTEYKVHLVPYFGSHAEKCQKRYGNIHGGDSSHKGGLLGWLGEMETEVDRLRTPDEIANHDWGMELLAKLLAGS